MTLRHHHQIDYITVVNLSFLNPLQFQYPYYQKNQPLEWFHPFCTFEKKSYHDIIDNNHILISTRCVVLAHYLQIILINNDRHTHYIYIAT